MNAVIQAESLAKEFDQLAAVKNLDLSVRQGEVLALLGPNGAGKTTTVRMLTSILKPTRGHATVAGFDIVREARQVRSVVGHLTEFHGLYLRMTARDYLEFYGELYGMSLGSRRRRASELLCQFGLADSSHRRLSEFSKGMRQKVALIRSMLHSPRVLFLDEPTSAMDPLSAKQVRDAIAQLRGNGHTVFLCTHNLYEAESLADRLALIRQGEMVALGTAAELKLRFLGAPLIELRLAKPLPEPFPSFNGLLQIEDFGETHLRYRTSNPTAVNPQVLRRLTEMGGEVVSLAELPQNLEQVYLKLVEHGMEDGGQTTDEC